MKLCCYVDHQMLRGPFHRHFPLQYAYDLQFIRITLIPNDISHMMHVMELWENRTVSTKFFLLINLLTSILLMTYTDCLLRIRFQILIMMVMTYRKKIHREKAWHLILMTWNRWWSNIITYNNFIISFFSFPHFLSIFLQLLKEPCHHKEHFIILSFNYIGIYSSEYNRAFRH